jgi:hypothetical protein
MLAFLFDRIHFPGVYMPDHTRLDLNGLQKEIERIAAYGRRDGNAVRMLNCLNFASVLDKVGDFCVFDDRPGGGTTFDKRAERLSLELEEAIFGKFPEGFIPITQGHSFKGLPGDDAYEVRCRTGGNAS